jgi:cell division transport system permease protein
MVIMKPEVNEARIIQLQKQLEVADFVKSSEYVTKEQAAAQMKDYLGEDFISFLGVNPLLPSINVKLNVRYANNDSLKAITDRMMTNPSVKEVLYQKTLVQELNANITLITGILLGFSLLLLVIAYALISNTIRLAVYSHRFLIRSMLLVGATSHFIRKPFVLKGLAQGAVAAVFAISMLTALMIMLRNEVPDLIALDDWMAFILLALAVIFAGLLLAGVSTVLAVHRYIRMKVDELYYF